MREIWLNTVLSCSKAQLKNSIIKRRQWTKKRIFSIKTVTNVKVKHGRKKATATCLLIPKHESVAWNEKTVISSIFRPVTKACQRGGAVYFSKQTAHQIFIFLAKVCPCSSSSFRWSPSHDKSFSWKHEINDCGLNPLST